MRRGWSIHLFPVMGIRLELHATFLLLLLYAAATGFGLDGLFGAAWSVAVVIGGFTCVVLHELGHSLTARFYGIGTHRILLLPIGGLAHLSEMPRDPRRELAIAVAGPLVNFALVGLIGAFLYLGYARVDFAAFAGELSSFSFSVVGFCRLMLFYNLAMGLFNCLPVFPMDGGRILRSLLGFRLSYLQATRCAIWVGRPLALLCLVLAVWVQYWLPAILFLFILAVGELEWRMVQRRERHWNLAVGNLTARRFLRLPPTVTLAQAADICLYEQPPELVVCEQEAVLAIFQPDELRPLLLKHPPETPLASLRRHPQMVQAHWPLATLGKQLETQTPARLPVYQEDKLLGILRLDQIDSLLEWHRTRTRAETKRWLRLPDETPSFVGPRRSPLPASGTEPEAPARPA